MGEIPFFAGKNTQNGGKTQFFAPVPLNRPVLRQFGNPDIPKKNAPRLSPRWAWRLTIDRGNPGSKEPPRGPHRRSPSLGSAPRPASHGRNAPVPRQFLHTGPKKNATIVARTIPGRSTVHTAWLS